MATVGNLKIKVSHPVRLEMYGEGKENLVVDAKMRSSYPNQNLLFALSRNT